MITNKVLPRPDADSRPFWKAAAEGRLEAQFCEQCDTPRFYPRLLCPECHSDEHRWEQLSGIGTVYSFTVVHRAPSPAFADDVPYVVALIDLQEGIRMMSNVVGESSEVNIGDPVKVRFREVDDSRSIPEFVRIGSES